MLVTLHEIVVSSSRKLIVLHSGFGKLFAVHKLWGEFLLSISLVCSM